MPTKRARTISVTSEVLKTVWPSRIVVWPSCGNVPTRAWKRTKKISEATAITISGTTRVRYTSASNGKRQRRCMRPRASAAAVPRTVESMELTSAILRLVVSALR